MTCDGDVHTAALVLARRTWKPSRSSFSQYSLITPRTCMGTRMYGARTGRRAASSGSMSVTSASAACMKPRLCSFAASQNT
eukprot:CAMPEP_0198361198 /NCGR_PEP_ID=MMETSP1450-20131203/141321_1 /TAXON_ID=753684 ORGANISM="Madagascaria erythrocladiodes, Strain CCMP3234" /NCGR_SAMPLE_ID=MMETSP1450 /ASSEMBLY_ACC=CAM_ASM_001115 /LENGTH=80 /DNA_ID=CAMNT_0044068293 /DNA_START=25 /DNA_END=264 /DNA_ORIENTATION=-